MKKAAAIILYPLFAVANAFAQRTRDAQLEDSIFSWEHPHTETCQLPEVFYS